MTIHEISPLIQASLGAGLLVLVLVKGGLSRSLTRWFVLFVIGQILWGLAVFGLRGNADLDWALRWERLAPAAVSLTVFSFYFFSAVMVRVSWPRWTVILATAHLLATLASIPTPYLVARVEVASYGNTAVWGVGLLPWTVPVYLITGFAIATLYRGYRSAPSYTEKNRLFLLLIAVAISLVGSLLDVAPALGIDVPPATSWTNSLFFVLAAVAILRFQLLDLQVALQHRVSYLLRSNANLGLVAIGVLIFWLVGLPVWSMVVLAIGLLLIAEPGWRRLDTLLRAQLEKDLASELQALLTLGAGQTGANTAQVTDTVFKVVQRVIRPSHMAMLLLEGDSARVLFSKGYVAEPNKTLSVSHPLVQWLRKEPGPAFHNDLMVEPQFQTMTRQNLKVLSGLDATVYVPFASHESLEAFLALGPKARDEIYSWQELEFLQALGQQAALLLESNRLLETERDQAERMEHMREIQRYMIEARDDERRSLAAEIHDDPIQMLVGSLVRISLIQEHLTTRPELSLQQLEKVTENLRHAEKSMRRIMSGVFPALLQDLGLLTAIEALCQDLQDSGLTPVPTHISVQVKGVASGWEPPLPVGLVIYRFVQEGLRNMLAHSGATEAKVTVDYKQDSGTVEVLDNGTGIDWDRVTTRRQGGHVGLLALEERLGSIGGSMNLSGGPKGGARLFCQFPHQSPSPDPEARWSFEYEVTPLSVVETQAEEASDKARVSSRR